MDMLKCLWLAQLVRNIDELTEAGEGGVEAMLPDAPPQKDNLAHNANASMLARRET